jgi:23S rRNA (cytosine1962-C5)-methyltransferase
MFKNRLVKVFRHLNRQAKKAGVSCYRIYDHDLPEFPVCIELYENHVYLAEYKRYHGLTESEHNSWLEGCLSVVKEVFNAGDENVHLKLRQRKPGRLGQYSKMGESKSMFVVKENGLAFFVNLTDYLDTGLFLDHRITRKMVMNWSAGATVLNLFAYTGSFSVYAAAGGAQKLVTADLSQTYLNWARKNMELNGFTDPAKYFFIQTDVLTFLPAEKENQYDLVILDPPTFSNSKRMNEFFDIQKDYPMLVNHCLRILKPGGRLLFSTNSKKFILQPELIEGITSLKDITGQTTPFDFEGRMERKCFLIIK